jgi:hypothetical protein
LRAEGPELIWLDHRLSSEIARTDVFGQPEIDQPIDYEMVVHGQSLLSAAALNTPNKQGHSFVY